METVRRCQLEVYSLVQLGWPVQSPQTLTRHWRTVCDHEQCDKNEAVGHYWFLFFCFSLESKARRLLCLALWSNIKNIQSLKASSVFTPGSHLVHTCYPETRIMRQGELLEGTLVSTMSSRTAWATLVAAQWVPTKPGLHHRTARLQSKTLSQIKTKQTNKKFEIFDSGQSGA